MKDVKLIPIKENDRVNFIRDLQEAFSIAAIKEYGKQVDPVISKSDIEKSIDTKGAETYHIVADGKIVGGTVIVINNETYHNSLDLLFINPAYHGNGIGLATWKVIEKKYLKTKVWETVTPYFEKRNIHFYVNKCGFKIIEFFNPHHIDPHMTSNDIPGVDYSFRFEKKMK